MYPTVFLLIIFNVFLYILYILYIFYSQVEGKYLLMVLPLGMLDVHHCGASPAKAV
jgi:hypothetical protein